MGRLPLALLTIAGRLAASQDIPLASGPLVDAQCNMESVEAANEGQLRELLVELTETTFFRLIHVNMENTCPYWGAPDEEPACESKAEDTAVPLCTLGTEEPAAAAATDPFGAAAMGASFGGGFGDASGMSETSSVSDAVDATLTSEEDAAQEGFSTEDCDNEELPAFWLDMCANIPTNSSGFVNLQLNPERYTGYNGSHVWAAIYEENCLLRTGGSEANICYEERVLYRLLSGMHAATNTHIARYYHAPSKRKGRSEWEPNLEYFSRQFVGHPERLKNMHFAFVLMLRALSRASPFLSSYSYAAAEAEGEEERIMALVRRLLDTSILSSCEPVFSAFDETLLFREQQAPWWSLKKQFKGVFHNISRVIDCVSCQKCRLHAKVTMLGFGSALKMLLLPAELIPTAISRDEVVALVNTLMKFSTAIHYVKELTAMQYRSFRAEPLQPQPVSAPAFAAKREESPSSSAAAATSATSGTTPPSPVVATPVPAGGGAVGGVVGGGAEGPLLALLDTGLARLAAAAKGGLLDAETEVAAVRRAIGGDARVLLLTKHFGGAPSFATHLPAALQLPPLPLPSLPALSLSTSAAGAAQAPAGAAGGGGSAYEVLVIGSGVAGMTAALRLLDSGAKVVLLEKEKRLGGNSAKASSGINGCCPQHSRGERNSNDTIDAFAADTARSAKREGSAMIQLLADSSASAIDWLLSRTSIDLSKIAQLGGHSQPRTHRPSNGMIGAELVFALQKEIKKFEPSGQLTILTGCRAQRFISEGGRVLGVEYADSSGASHELRVADTVLTTGGFANDRTNTSLLAAHRPDLLRFPTTNGEWATGDGVKMGTDIGAGLVDMDKVQIHPTGFVDPTDVGSPTKVLCGEMMRGVGGLLLTPRGRRFGNELAPRDKVVDAELATGWAEFALLLNERAAVEAGKHTELYTRKGLLVKLDGAAAVAAWMASAFGSLPLPPNETAPLEAAAVEAELREELAAYDRAAAAGSDGFGKRAFHNAPFGSTGTFYAGRIVPVLHYTMGGLSMDEQCSVLRSDGSPVPGLHAAGEVTGGVHGNNRLGGNSLLECTVFGSIVGNKLANTTAQRRAAAATEAALLASSSSAAPAVAAAAAPAVAAAAAAGSAAGGELRSIGRAELAMHASADDCWVALHGKVYDFTSFLEEHPAGPESIVKLGGTDGTEMFDTVHNVGMLEEFTPDLVGKLA